MTIDLKIFFFNELSTTVSRKNATAIQCRVDLFDHRDRAAVWRHQKPETADQIHRNLELAKNRIRNTQQYVNSTPTQQLQLFTVKLSGNQSHQEGEEATSKIR